MLIWGRGIGASLNGLGRRFKSKAPCPHLTAALSGLLPSLYENSGIGVRIRSERVYENLRNPHAVAIVGQFGPERVRRYQLLARSPSIRRAALAMGWNPPTLYAQLKVLERSCGGALINRHRPTREHQKLTPLGQRLLDQADDHFGRPMLAKERSA